MIRHFEKWSLLILPLSFPLAQAYVTVFAIPLYYPELLIGAALLFRIVGRKSFPSPPKGLAIGAVIMFSGAVMSLLWNGPTIEGLGILKSWFFFPILAAYLISINFKRQSDQERMLILWFCADVAVAIAALVWLPFNHLTFDGRLSAWYPSPNHLAMYLESGLLIGLYLLTKDWKSNLNNGILAASSIGTVAILTVIVYTRSVAAMGTLALCVFVGWMFMQYEFRKAFRISVITSVIATAAVTCFLLLNWAALSSGLVRSSLASRVMIWNASVAMIADHPMMGIGPGNFQSTYLVYQERFPRYLEWAVPHPHDVYLAFWLNAGIIGLAGFIITVISIVNRILHRLKADTETESKNLSILVLLLFMVMLAHGLVDTSYFKNEYADIFWIMVAFIAAKKTAFERRPLDD